MKTEVTPKQKERTAATIARIVELKKKYGAREAAGGDKALNKLGYRREVKP